MNTPFLDGVPAIAPTKELNLMTLNIIITLDI